MTKEEIKQKAEEYLYKELREEYRCINIPIKLVNVLVGFAQELKYDKGCETCCKFSDEEKDKALDIAEKVNRSVNAMNKKLEKDCDKFRNMFFDGKEKIANLEAQIEKMKRCQNCEYEDYDTWTGKKCEGCKHFSNWQLKE